MKKYTMDVHKTTTFQVYHASSGSDTSTSSSSSANSDTPLRRFNRLLRSSVASHWTYFRKNRPPLRSRGRSSSDNGLCSIVDNDSELDFMPIPDARKRRSYQQMTTRVTLPKLMLSSSGSAVVGAVDEHSDGSDGERRHLRVPTPHPHHTTQSTGNFASGAAGGCGAPRSAPATPLQLEPTRPMKHDKQAVKPLSSSVPSVRAATTLAPSGGGVSDASEGKAPSKARQKKFLRHFPQVGPEEKVLNYYSCALVGDILLQGHLYITRNYFAFYSNVFGYVTKLLIPTGTVLRVSKEKMARIIPNAVGVCTRTERHVFGSLLSRDSTYKLMTSVWKSARAVQPPPQELRVSEAELDASEFSVEDETSSAGGGDQTDGRRGPIRRENETLIAGPGVAAAVIQPALLTGAPCLAPARAQLGLPRAALLLAAALLAALAIVQAGKLYATNTRADEELARLSGSELYSELVRWRARLHGRAASELQAFLTTNLLLLTKVRQSLEALSGVILTDMAQAGPGAHTEVPPNDTTLS